MNRLLRSSKLNTALLSVLETPSKKKYQAAAVSYGVLRFQVPRNAPQLQHSHCKKLDEGFNRYYSNVARQGAPYTSNIWCWFCAEHLEPMTVSCQNCGYIQKLNKDGDYFTLFELKQDFFVDLTKLQKNFQKLQLQVHPDKFARQGEDLKKLAEAQSSMLNTAYSVLRSPLERAKYLLDLKGMPLQEDCRLEDPSFLMQVMEFREEALAAPDSAAVSDLLKANTLRMQACEAGIAREFAAGDLQAAQRLVQELIYWHRLEETLKDRL